MELLVGVAWVVNGASGRDAVDNYTTDSSCAPETGTRVSKESVGGLISGVVSLTVAFSRLQLAPPSLFIPLKMAEITEQTNTGTAMLFSQGVSQGYGACLTCMRPYIQSPATHMHHVSCSKIPHASQLRPCLKLRSTKETALQLRAFLRCALQKVPTSPHRKCLNGIDVE